MYLRSELLTQGLSQFDIDDLDQDNNARDAERMRDLVMGLYLRARYSEKKVAEYSTTIERLMVELTCSMFVGSLFGLSIGLGLYALA